MRDDFFACVSGYEITDSPFVIDDFLILEIIVGAYHGIGVHFHRSGIFAYGGDALLFPVYVAQDFVHNPVGYLQVNGFVLLEIHRLKSFRSVICDVANNL